jgi:hypothetical protein
MSTISTKREMNLETITESRTKEYKTIIPAEHIRVESIDYSLEPQMIPFFLKDKHRVNSIDKLNIFLKNDDDIICEYLRSFTKCHCLYFSERVAYRMMDFGINAIQMLGYYDLKSNLDKIDMNNLSKTPDVDVDIRFHSFVVAKFKSKGIVNEFLLDYSGDIIGDGSVIPIVAPRDKLASIYGITSLGPYSKL